LDGCQSSGIFLCFLVHASAGAICSHIDAVGGVKFTSHGVPYGLAGDVLNGKPCLEQKGKINNAENDHQEDRQSQHEFNGRLCTRTLFSEFSTWRMKKFDIHKLSLFLVNVSDEMQYFRRS
jgi:hypothetical protein